MLKAVLASLVVVALGAAPAPSAPVGPLDFTLVNKTGLVITHVYVSPSDSDHWGEDIMEKDVLGKNESVDIVFDRSETTCKWDLKIIDDDEDEVEWNELNLCKASKITLKYENKRATAIIE
ncbi:MAG: argininosuccinate lyase [Gemmatimonadetes bacterium]|nr:argininosuccinate lyase [Gemmatimonadota bacterium]